MEVLTEIDKDRQGDKHDPNHYNHHYPTPCFKLKPSHPLPLHFARGRVSDGGFEGLRYGLRYGLRE